MNKRILETAIQAAQAAGDAIIGIQDKPLRIQEKGYLDIVTDADLAADEAIQAIIELHFPNHFILSEESKIGSAVANGEVWNPPDDYWWAIDPIDGTTNFSRGTPSWCISIAVGQGETLQVGVIYDLERDHLFAAARGEGATLNGDPIHVSDTELQRTLVGADWAVNAEKRQQMIDLMNKLLPHVRSLRCWGTSALSLAHVAAGFLDAYAHNNFKIWDVGAGVLLIQEAGGTVTTLTGDAWGIHDSNLLVSNGILHAELLQMIAN